MPTAKANAQCSPSVSFAGSEATANGYKLTFHVKNNECAASTGDFRYTIRFRDGSELADQQALSWTAADCTAAEFDYFFEIPSAQELDVVTDISDIRCTCV